MGDLISTASKKYSQGKIQEKWCSMKVVAESCAIWSNTGGSRQAHYEKVAQGRSNAGLLANCASGECSAQHIVHSPAAGRGDFRQCFVCGAHHFSVPNLTGGWRPPWLQIVSGSKNFLARPCVAFMKAHLVDTEVLEALRMASQRDPKPHVFEHTCTLHWDAFVRHSSIITGWAGNPMKVAARVRAQFPWRAG